MVACIGPLATISCEPRQARKGAAAAADSGAGVRLVRAATLTPFIAGKSFHKASGCCVIMRPIVYLLLPGQHSEPG